MSTILLAVAAAGLVIAAASAIALRLAGGDVRTARRLAGPPEVSVGAVLELRAPTNRPVRVSGRIRCLDPVQADDGERLVAYHRDVEVRLPRGGWRTVERLRETRSFELWDHAGSLTVDPARASEPLLTIPKVWRGDAGELPEPHASAVRTLEERHGVRALEARATTRTLSLTDRLLLLGRVSRAADGTVTLDPPEGGYLVTNLALPDAMRLLGGRHRRVLAASMVGIALGGVLAVGGLVAAAVAAAIGG